LIGQGGGQIDQQVGARGVANAEAHTSSPAHGLRQKTFSHAALPYQDPIAPAADEVAGGQFLDLRPVDGRIEGPVELV